MKKSIFLSLVLILIMGGLGNSLRALATDVGGNAESCIHEQTEYENLGLTHSIKCSNCGENLEEEAHVDENADMCCDACNENISNLAPSQGEGYVESEITLNEKIKISISANKNEVSKIIVSSWYDINSKNVYETEAIYNETTGLYEAVINFADVNGENGKYNFDASIYDASGNMRYVRISEVSYTKNGISNVKAYRNEEGNIEVEVKAVEGGEIYISTNGEVPTENSNWQEYNAGETYTVEDENEEIETVNVYYRSSATVSEEEQTNYGVMATSAEVETLSETTTTGPQVGDYVNYPVTYTNMKTNQGAQFIPRDEFVGWRVLDVEGDTVKLVSAGVPLLYYHDRDGAASVTALTTDFLATSYSQSGFTESFSTIFKNDYTNSVSAMTKEDLDKVYGSTTKSGTTVNDAKYNDLLAIPCKDNTSRYAMYWLPSVSTSTSSKMWAMDFGGFVFDSALMIEHGVRPVVTLKSNVVFTGKDASGKWNIEVGPDQKAMITEWTIPSGDTTITLPVAGDGLNVIVDWGDGSDIQTVTSYFPNHTYAEAGTYDITIKGTCSEWGLISAYIEGGVPETSNQYTYTKYLTGLKQWGELEATIYGFSYCSNLKYVSGDATENTFKNVTDMTYMFYNCKNLTSIDLSNFNTEKVTDMDHMFSACSSLTSLIFGANFNTSNVTEMSCMFESNTSLTSLDLSNFNTSKATNMRSMFAGCTSLTNLNISSFDTQNVTNMTSMFSTCTALTDLNLSNFNTSKVTNMSSMFGNCNSLTNLNISSFNTSNVTNMSWMFAGPSKMTSLDLSHFNTSKVTNMSAMFRGASMTSINVSSFDTSNVTNMSDMFQNCKCPTLDLSNFNTSKVTNMSLMFIYSGIVDLDISNFDTSSVINMASMFEYSSKIKKLDLSSFDTSKVTNINRMFVGMSNDLTILISNKFSVKSNMSFTGMIPTNRAYKFILTSSTPSGDQFGLVADQAQNVTFYVPNQGFEDYENTWSNSIAIEPIIKLNGEKNIKLNIGGTYTEAGYTVIGETPEAALEILPTKYTSKITGTVDTKNEGTYEIKYQVIKTSGDAVVATNGDVNLNEEVIAEEKRTVTVEDKSKYMITTWEIPSGDTVITLPVTGTVNLKIDWGDGKVSGDITTEFPTHTYAEAGTYEIKISGTCGTWGYSNWEVPTETTKANYYTYTQYITSLSQWGELGVSEYGFSNCTNLKTVSGEVTENTFKNVTSMFRMFYNCSNLTTLNVSNFATGNVTSMSGMFFGCSGLTSLDVSNFVIGNVQYMDSMFDGCMGLTTLDVSNFATGNVTNMGRMFLGCTGLTTLDVSNWNTGNVTNMNQMFYGCSGLTTLDVSNFATGNVTSMGYMFSGCSGLTSLDVSNFATGNVEYMNGMFLGCTGLTTLDVSNLATGNVTDMNQMFSGCRGLTILDVSNFATGNVTNMGWMFYGCSGLTTLDVSNWNTGNVTSMQGMFRDCSGLTTLDVSNFATGNVTDMSSMFSGCRGLTTLDVSNFATGNVTNMGWMFYGCSGLTSIQVSNKFVVPASNNSNMFYNTPNLSAIIFTSKTPSGDQFGSVASQVSSKTFYVPNDSVSAYQDAWNDSLTIEPILQLEGEENITLEVGNDYEEPGYTVAGFGLENSGDYTVYGYNVETSGEVKTNTPATYTLTYDLDRTYSGDTITDDVAIDTRTVEVVQKTAFAIYSADDNSLRFYKDLIVPTSGEYEGRTITAVYTGIETSWYDKATNVPWYSIRGNITTVVVEDEVQPISTRRWFFGMHNATIIDVEKLNTSNVTDMSLMFSGNNNYMKIPTLDVSNFDTSKVITMYCMFQGCNKLTNININNFNTSNVTDMTSMFSRCSKLVTLNVSNWDTSNVTNMAGVFYDCSNLETLDVSGWNTSKVITMNSIFSNCSKLTIIDVSNWDTSNVTDMKFMFGGSSSTLMLLETLDVSNFNTSKVTTMYAMFQNCINLKTLDVSNWDTSNVTDMSYMFSTGALKMSLETLDVSNWNTSKVTTMYQLFANCVNLKTLDVSNWDTSNVTDMIGMFAAGVDNEMSLESLDVSNFNTSKVTTMRRMFQNCVNLKAIDVSKWNTSNVIDMAYTFTDCNALENINVTNFNTSKVKSMYAMFGGCTSLTNLDLSSFDTSSIATGEDMGMSYMFSDSSNLKSILVSNKFVPSGDVSEMFSGATSLTKIITVSKNIYVDQFTFIEDQMQNITFYVPNSGLDNYRSTWASIADEKIKPILTVSKGNESIRLGYSFEDDATYEVAEFSEAEYKNYEVYGYKVSKSGDVNSYASGTYPLTYSLTRTFNSGDESVTEEVATIIRNIIVEESFAPTNFIASGDADLSMTLTFDKDEETTVIIEVRNEAGSFTTLTENATSPYRIEDLLENTTYEYRVYAVKNGAASEYVYAVGSTPNEDMNLVIKHDNIKPSIKFVSISPALEYVTKDDTLTVTFTATDRTYNAETSNILSGDIIVLVSGDVNNDAIKTLTKASNSSGEKFTLTITNITGNGEVSVVVPAGKIIDKAGNANDETPFDLNTYVESMDVSAITITADVETLTSGDVNVTINFGGSRYNKEYSLDNSTWTKVTENETVLRITSNKTVYARFSGSTDSTESVSYVVDNIDKEKPVIGSVTIEPEGNANSKVITISGIEDKGIAGIKGYYISNVLDLSKATWTNLSETEFIYNITENGTYYIWVSDNALNISEAKTVYVTGIVQKVTDVNIPDSIEVKIGEEKEFEITYNGTPKDISFEIEDENIIDINENIKVVKGLLNGNTKVTVTITDYDGTTRTKDVNVIVNTLELTANLSLNGEPYNGEWTSGDVLVTLTVDGTNPNSYKEKDGEDGIWGDISNFETDIGTGIVTITYSGDMDSEIYYVGNNANGTNITNVNGPHIIKIDKTAPEVGSTNITVEENSIIVKIEGALDEGVGIKEYVVNIYKDDELVKEIISETSEVTFEDLTSSTEYKVTYKVIDNLGNETETIDAGTATTKEFIGVVSYVANGVKIKEVETVAGQAVDLTVVAEKTGYEFKGWSKEENGKVLEGLIMPEEDVTLYAIFKDETGPTITNKAYETIDGNLELIIKAEDDGSGLKDYSITTDDSTPGEWILLPEEENGEYRVSVPGTNTYYVWVRDFDGNFTMYEQTAIKDIFAPTGTIEIIGTNIVDDLPYSNVHEVTLKITAEDNISPAEDIEIAIYNEEDYVVINDYSEIIFNRRYEENFETVWRTTMGDGLKRIYIIFRDKAGNISMTIQNIEGFPTSEYKVYYYIQNVAGTGYELSETVTRTGRTDSDSMVFNIAKVIKGTDFEKASEAPNGEAIETFTVAEDGTTEIYLYYTRNKMVITFEANGGSGDLTSKEIIYGDVYGELPSLTKEGFTFLGWFTSNEGGEKIERDTVVTSSKTLYARWKGEEYTITLDHGDGITTTKDVNLGSCYGELPTLEKEGYTFDGWYNEDGEKVTSDTIVENDSDLTAKFTAKTYTVKYMANGGNIDGLGDTYTTRKVTYGSTYGNTGIEYPTVTRTGYNFLGWFDEETGEGPITEETAVTTKANGQVLEAKWEAIVYTIGYNLDGGTLDGENPTTFTIESAPITLKNPTKVGYTFLGWATSAANTPQTTLTIQTGSRGNRTYIAFWEEETYQITYNLDGGSVNSTNQSSYSVTSDEITLENPTKEGYEFAGWTEEIKTTNWSAGYIDETTGEVTESTEYPNAVNSEKILLKENVTYTLEGNENTDAELRIYDLDGNYIESKTASAYVAALEINFNIAELVAITYTPTKDCYAKIILHEGSTQEKNNTVLKTTTQEIITIKTGSTGNRNYKATWTEILEATAFAVYSADDGSLIFYKNTDYKAIQKALDAGTAYTYKEKTVTEVYTGIEETQYTGNIETLETNVPWIANAQNITKVEVKDEISPISTAAWFAFASNCETIDIRNLDTSKVTDMTGMFGYAGHNKSTFEILGLEDLDTSNVTNMSAMFYECISLTELDLSKWNVGKVTSLYCTFAGYEEDMKLTSVGNISNWDTSNVLNMEALFQNGVMIAELNISNWNVGNVTNMRNMFRNCCSLTNLDLSKWVTSNVTNTWTMFYNFGNSENPATLDLSSFDTTNVTNMQYMFNNANIKEIKLGEKFVWKDVENNPYLPDPSLYMEEADGKWYDVETGIGYEPANVPSGKAATYSAIPRYEVRFEANGGNVGGLGSTYTTRWVTYGKTYGEVAAEFPTAEREGYKFLGWYTSGDSETLVSGDTVVDETAEGLVLYAKWEAILTVNAPVLGDGMKAVYWLNEDGTGETTADEHTTAMYSYVKAEDKEDSKQSKWANAKTTEDGSYWVWIPRYAYKITYYEDETKSTTSTTKTKYGDIDVLFMKGISNEEYYDGKGGTITGLPEGYKVHPAFKKMDEAIYGKSGDAELGNPLGKWNTELEGIWVAKYEASQEISEDSGTTWKANEDTAGYGGGDNLTVENSTRVVSKPSRLSWRSIRLTHTYENSLNMFPDLNSHLMKNSEWGAVAYLAHSSYGRNGIEIGYNQCSSNYTGAGPGEGTSTVSNSTYAYDASTFESTYAWNTAQGKLASTTGNIYGIYDMLGGACEFVASYVNNGDEKITGEYNGGQLGLATDMKTKQVYPSTVTDGSESRFKDYALAASIYGDAIYETSISSMSYNSWNGDYSYFPSRTEPFFIRGENYGTSQSIGMFSFAINNGYILNKICTFRPVLCVTRP